MNGYQSQVEWAMPTPAIDEFSLYEIRHPLESNLPV